MFRFGLPYNLWTFVYFCLFEDLQTFIFLEMLLSNESRNQRLHLITLVWRPSWIKTIAVSEDLYFSISRLLSHAAF